MQINFKRSLVQQLDMDIKYFLIFLSQFQIVESRDCIGFWVSTHSINARLNSNKRRMKITECSWIYIYIYTSKKISINYSLHSTKLVWNPFSTDQLSLSNQRLLNQKLTILIPNKRVNFLLDLLSKGISKIQTAYWNKEVSRNITFLCKIQDFQTLHFWSEKFWFSWSVWNLSPKTWGEPMCL